MSELPYCWAREAPEQVQVGLDRQQPRVCQREGVSEQAGHVDGGQPETPSETCVQRAMPSALTQIQCVTGQEGLRTEL